ncbi:radical SAM/SPASM domain-containing protein [Heliorestis convoluta]|uniref:Radical SAM protein n=1 Tax=Heliorestis convoluta TaxID=356322 RepID=A0A5Q2N3K5_9FIRM|nr:radical SAM/SPASM domain-containing protein [Heliorestis convoluta]QGG48901.1 radical SAM protein [Heliorestis convoluta]
MKAKMSKWCEGERIRLADVVPLDTPISLLIEPSSVCNFRCFYCFHGNMQEEIKKLGHMNKVMEYSIFEKLIKDALIFPRQVKAINLSRFGEPLINKKITEMVYLAKSSGACNMVKIITNGSLLTPQLNKNLISSGLDVLRISIQGISEKQIFDTCGYKINFYEFVRNIEDFYKNRGNCKVFIKILDNIVSNETEKFYQIFGNICDEISIEHLIENKNYVAIKDKGKKELINMMGEKCDNVDVCSSPFYSLNIAADGSISPCCNDIEGKIIFGNVVENSLVDVWNSKKLNLFRVMHLQEKRYHHQVCGRCCAPTYTNQRYDNIDSVKKSLLKHYNT